MFYITMLLSFRYFRTVARVSVGVGAVFITVDQGVWGGTSEATNTLKRIRSRYLPETNEYLNSVSDFKISGHHF